MSLIVLSTLEEVSLLSLVNLGQRILIEVSLQLGQVLILNLPLDVRLLIL